MKIRTLTSAAALALPLVFGVGCAGSSTTADIGMEATPQAIVRAGTPPSPIKQIGPMELKPSLEHRTDDGAIFTASTQSLLRQKHWLESTEEVTIAVRRDGLANVTLRKEGDPPFIFRNVPIEYLVPRLYYPHAGKLDDFDAFNLMLAEYSRNGINMPTGSKGDAIAHFETHLDGAAPYTNGGSYQFIPNPSYLPIRAQVVNNCLRPGLWEVGAGDTAGEIYHAWFELPSDKYYNLVAWANGISNRDFLKQALAFDEREVPLDLPRLRHIAREVGTNPLRVSPDDRASYSSQDSRRKLSKGFVRVPRDNGEWTPPKTIGEVTATPVKMTSFIEPGLYSRHDAEEFDLRFLRGARQARFYMTQPKTTYDPNAPQTAGGAETLELHLELDDATILLGNLPIDLLVPQQEFAINGYGVGVLAPSDLAERRAFQIADGPPPSFAYIAVGEPGNWKGVNSHKWGLEQIFIRPRLHGDTAILEITLTSYERIVDIIRYEVAIPAELVPAFKKARDKYVPPVFYSHRDDNIR